MGYRCLFYPYNADIHTHTVLANPEEASSAYKCLEKGADDYIILPIRLPVAKNMWSTVWKKKRERRTLDLLYTERAICTEKEKILKDLVRNC